MTKFQTASFRACGAWDKVESQAAAQCLVLAHNRIGSIFRGCIAHAVCAGRAIASPSIIVTMRLIVRPLRLFHEEADLPANASPRRMPPTATLRLLPRFGSE